MVWNPLKLCLAGALTISGVGVIIINSIGSSQFEDFSDNIRPELENVQTTNSQTTGTSQGNVPSARTLPTKCYIYITEEPTYTWLWGIQVYRIKKDPETRDSFLKEDGQNEQYKRFLKAVNKYGCYNGRERVYVYKEGDGKWVYNHDLQRKDWRYLSYVSKVDSI